MMNMDGNNIRMNINWYYVTSDRIFRRMNTIWLDNNWKYRTYNYIQ